MEPLLEKIKLLFNKKSEKELASATLDRITKEYTALSNEILKMMESLDLEKQHVPGFGTVSRQENWSVKVPKTPDEKTRVFDYIREKYGQDALMGYVTINSNSLNAFYKQEFELAKERKDVRWKLPGIEEPSVYFKLGVRKS